MPEVCPNMPEVCPKFARSMPEVCPKYEFVLIPTYRNMPEYAQSIRGASRDDSTTPCDNCDDGGVA